MNSSSSSYLPAYVGRFAPSPSGPLHFGSLVTALASYLQAKTQHGTWLLRIDDIDPPREMPGATDLIQQQLVDFGLLWDGDVVMQSANGPDYEKALAQLRQASQCYYCSCTRKDIKARGGIYDGYCRNRSLSSEGTSVRFINEGAHTGLRDAVQGSVELDSSFTSEDFILKRKDGLYAYHLASVVDDISMGITEIVRGADLLAPSVCQQSLFTALGAAPPAFMHLPVAASKPGFKLSKQNHAMGLDANQASELLYRALVFLGQSPPGNLCTAKVPDIIEWASVNWQTSSIPSCKEILL